MKLTGRCEELQGDVVRVAEREARAIRGVDHSSVSDAKIIEAFLPRLQLCTVGASEGDVVKPRPQLVEAVGGRGLAVLVNAEQRAPKEPHDVVERAGILVQNRCGVEELLVPGAALTEVIYRHSNMGERREVGHVKLLLHRLDGM